MEAFEVFGPDAPRADVRKRKATPCRGLLRAPVRRLTDVIGMCAGRINLEQLVEPRRGNMIYYPCTRTARKPGLFGFQSLMCFFTARIESIQDR
jgi:hypothetical protein